MKPRMLFYRQFLGYSGGHGKVWDYFGHAIALGWDARVFLTPDSLRDASNPWLHLPGRIIEDWRPERTDALFIAGLDWRAVPPGLEYRVPVVNLIQHVRHSFPDDERYAFLPRRATRICVAPEVAAAIEGTGRVDGEIHSIPNAIRRHSPESGRRPGSVLVAAVKAPELGASLQQRLRAAGVAVTLLDTWQDLPVFHGHLAASEIVVALPHPSEGFFLPALEAMAYGCAVVTCDAIGNRSYLQHEQNALVVQRNAGALAAAVIGLLQDPSKRRRLATAARETAVQYSPEEERSRFAAVLERAFAGIHPKASS